MSNSVMPSMNRPNYRDFGAFNILPEAAPRQEIEALPKIYFMSTLKDRPWGGANQFLKALKREMEKAGACSQDACASNAILFNLDPSPDYVERWMRLIAIKRSAPRTLVIARIAGPIALARGKDAAWDRILYKFCDAIADGIVYQSEWSRRENRRCGLKQNGHELVALNAPDRSIFTSEGRQLFHENRKMRLIGSSWSTNPRKGLSVFQWLDRNLDFSKYEVTFVGNAPAPFAHIRTIPPLASRALADEMKCHDLFIFPSRVEACSNSLVEALHCGLPAIAYAGSSNPEVVGNAGEFFRQKEEIPCLLEKMADSMEGYSSRICLPDISQVCDLYVTFVKAILREAQSGAYTPKKCGAWDPLGMLATILFRLQSKGALLLAHTLVHSLADGGLNYSVRRIKNRKWQKTSAVAAPACRRHS
jgi:hypothetical protein